MMSLYLFNSTTYIYFQPRVSTISFAEQPSTFKIWHNLKSPLPKKLTTGRQPDKSFLIFIAISEVQDMGICMKQTEPSARQPNASELQKNKAANPPQIESVDVVKMKLKQARDRIKVFINKKNADIAQLEVQIKQKLPEYQKSKNKKILIPLLQAKKNLLNIVEQGDVRLKLVNEKLGEVEMAQLNKETIEVLDQSNKYINEIQNDLENKDWRGVLADAQNKYEMEWPDDRDELEEDPAFQQMWNELGGNKIAKTVEKKNVKVEIKEKEVQQQEKKMAFA